jgi:hypothetical protein
VLWAPKVGQPLEEGRDGWGTAMSSVNPPILVGFDVYFMCKVLPLKFALSNNFGQKTIEQANDAAWS